MSRSREIEPEPKPNGPADLGWTKKATASASGPRGKTATTGQVVPDPGISHGAFKVLQRVDGVHFVFDTRAPPGEGAIELFPIVRAEHETKEDAVKRVRKAAEAACIRYATEAEGTTT